MGTVGYMSPEQVRGLDADHRSDIFSFGVVLHEMLGGARPFEGETAVDTMQAILREDAPDLPSTVPAGVRQVVSHCLEKDPAHRFQSARDLGFALRALAQGDSSSGSAPAVESPAPPASAHPRVAGGGCGPARHRRHRPHHPGTHARASSHDVVRRAAGRTGRSRCTRVVRRMAGSWPSRRWWTGRRRWA